MRMLKRRRLLAKVRARVRQFDGDRNPAIVLAAEAVAEVTALLESVPDPTADLQVAHAAGWLHWFRYLVLVLDRGDGDGDGEQDLAAALALFVPVYQAHPGAVPPRVRTRFGRGPLTSVGDSQALASRGIRLLEETLRSGDRAVLDTSVGLLRQAVAATAPDHPNLAAMLSSLSTALVTRFGSTGDQADLDAAVDAGRQAVAGAPAGHPDRAAMVSNLSIVLRTRFELSGDQADLDAAVDASRQAVAATPPDDPDRAERVSNLGFVLRTRFELSGDQADLDAAVDASRQAVAATPPDDPDRAARVSHLSIVLQTRFERLGDQTDLDEAVDASRQAVAATPPDDPDQPGMVSNLGYVLRTRFERFENQADLDEAVDTSQQAVAATAPDHPDRAAMLSNLSAALGTQYSHSGEPADLDAAVDAGRQAVAATPPDHAGLALNLSNLGLALRIRFERLGEQADLDEAVDTGRQAVAATPPDHASLATTLSNLGNALQLRFERFGEQADLDEAVAAGREAASVEVASPRVRAAAARNWGRVAAASGRWLEAVDGFTAAITLLGRVAPRSLARGDQEHLLDDLGGLGSDAAACCVHAGLTHRAVELFEQGRGVLLGQALDSRTDLSALTELHPDLAGRFAARRDELDSAGNRSRPLTMTGADGPALHTRADLALEAARRRRAATAFDRAVAEIRELPGFNGFLQPPQARELTAAATGGPVVIVNVSRFGSHALILTSGGVLEPVPLTALTPEAVYEWVLGFLIALDEVSSPFARASSRLAAEQWITDMLGWLWDAVASPVLGRLGIIAPPEKDAPWPRVWWCVSGLLSFLPLHAAGRHDTRYDAAPATVIDRVVSSYTPTVRALTHARRGNPHSTSGRDDEGMPAGGRVVAVAMPHTPGESDLPGAAAEVAGLQRRLPGQVSVLTGPAATRGAVLAALPGARWAHFACHGAADPADPSASHLLLADHQQRTLTVVDVARLRLDGAELAFLSACETARPGGRLTDEAIHLTSAFQLAGYRHVIGTLWPIGDVHAVAIAADIYTALTDGGDVAGAVHTATRRLRNRWTDTPSVWASHIHAGA
ncbi:CHAT domain-containing protein [Parafrankia sp. BMG5.11]|nr:CHAT domain-containing protein [Parafrankia sp. BMG5.11]